MIPDTKLSEKLQLLPPQRKSHTLFLFKTESVDTANPKRPVKKEYTRKVKIIYYGKAGDYFQFQLLCAKIEEKGDKSVGFSFLRTIAFVFDEVILSINLQGEIEKIHNGREIRLRWGNIKTDLMKVNDGYEMESHFNLIDSIVKSEEQMISFLSKPKMYGLYFNGYWGNYSIKELSSPLGFYKEKSKEKIQATSAESGLLHLRVEPEEGKKKSEIYFIYEDHQLKEAVCGQKISDTQHLKYSALCFGERKKIS